MSGEGRDEEEGGVIYRRSASNDEVEPGATSPSIDDERRCWISFRRRRQLDSDPWPSSQPSSAFSWVTPASKPLLSLYTRASRVIATPRTNRRQFRVYLSTQRNALVVGDPSLLPLQCRWPPTYATCGNILTPLTSPVLGTHPPNCQCSTTKFCIKFRDSAWNLVIWFSEKYLQICCHQISDFEAKMHQISFRLGLRPIPRWESLQRYSDP